MASLRDASHRRDFCIFLFPFFFVLRHRPDWCESSQPVPHSCFIVTANGKTSALIPPWLFVFFSLSSRCRDPLLCRPEPHKQVSPAVARAQIATFSSGGVAVPNVVRKTTMVSADTPSPFSICSSNFCTYCKVFRLRLERAASTFCANKKKSAETKIKRICVLSQCKNRNTDNKREVRRITKHSPEQTPDGPSDHTAVHPPGALSEPKLANSTCEQKMSTAGHGMERCMTRVTSHLMPVARCMGSSQAPKKKQRQLATT